MRAIQVTAALVALAVAFPVAQPAAAQNPLSSIFSCQASGGKQAGGAVLGGVVGGVLGNRLSGGNRTLGTALGAAVGAAAGSYVGCRMQQSDQRKAQAAAQDALDRNRNSSWTNAETGASGDVRMVSSGGGYAPVSMNGMRFAAGVEPASGYESAGGVYRSRTTSNLRSSPGTSGYVVGKLAPGETFDALAKVQGTNWLLAGRGGVGIGYVSQNLVDAVGAPPSSAASNCRTFDQTIRTQGGAPETQRYTACKNVNGEWVVQA